LTRRDISSTIEAVGGQVTKKALGLGKLIREARLRNGLTQTDLAKRVGLTQTAISEIERGLYAPNSLLLGRIARELGLSMEEVMKALEAHHA